MTATNFPQSLSYVLENEGGYVNHPADPGGATNKGVTQAVYDDWRAARGLMKQSVRLIAPPEVSAI
jgi:lysozyme family protein